MCYALHFQYADHSNIWVTSALFAKHNHHSVCCTYLLVCDLLGWHCVFRVYQCWVRLRFSLPNRYLTTALGGRPGPICILHSPKCPNDEMRASWYTLGYWSDVADMSHHRSYYISAYYTTLTKISQWWAPHTVHIDGAVYHRIKSSHRVHLWSGFCLICLAYYIRTLHLS